MVTKLEDAILDYKLGARLDPGRNMKRDNAGGLPCGDIVLTDRPIRPAKPSAVQGSPKPRMDGP